MSPRERIVEGRAKASHDTPVRILLIDDDEHLTRAVATYLQGRGFEVRCANSGRDGLRAAADESPDLVVCDLEMPVMDGYEVLTRLRQDASLADIPLIFLTGRAAPQQIRAGMNVGADDYLTKPVDPDELLRALKARLARAKAGRQQQEQQMERAMQMFAGIVHDLRDPLFVVFGYSNLLRQGGPPVKSGKSAGEILDRMQQAIVRMQTIVSETLFLAKSKMQRLPFDPVPFDLRVLCEQVISDQDQGVRLQFDCQEQEYPIVGDPLRLRQALENLIINALKYSEAAIKIGLAKRRANYVIEVTDQGIGIPEAECARIFEPFFRASNTASKPGHGLGLSIVKACVEQQGGKVEFVSKVGTGTTFTFEVPARAPAADQPTPGRMADFQAASFALKPSSLTNDAASGRAPVATPTFDENKPASDSGAKGAELSCIIVDDDPLVRDVLRDLLTHSGEIRVTGEAGSVAQAQRLVAQGSPQVVFLDVHLPDATGFDLLPHLEPTTAVVFVTSAEEYALNAFDSDAVDYLLKPVSAERLQKTLLRVRQRIAARSATAGASGLGLEDTFLVKTMSEKKLIKVRDVKRVIAYGEYSWVYWHGGKGALLRKTLKQWETELPDGQFVRIHRNAIINLAFLERVEKRSSGQLWVHLRDTAEPISVSLRLAPTLNRKLQTFKA